MAGETEPFKFLFISLTTPPEPTMSNPDFQETRSDVVHIPLEQLQLSEDNVRGTPVDDAAATELKASIHAHGLLQSLVVRPVAPNPRAVEPDGFEVVAGGRRLAALIALHNEGKLARDHRVPCRVVRNDAQTKEISLAENVVRVSMHPADQVETFAALVEQGSAVTDIAARFGVSERTVEQRLRLGNAAPDVLQAYRDGHIDMETLTAFAVTTDRERQIAVWNQIKDQGYRPGAWQVKRLLTEDSIQASDSIVRFVDLDDYLSAGGTVTRDLFADDEDHGVWIDDPQLLQKLAQSKLDATADKLRPEWKWVEARIDVNWDTTGKYGEIRSEPGKPTEDEQAEITALHARIDALDKITDEQKWSDELNDEYISIQDRLPELNAIVDSRKTYHPKHKAIAGCFVTIGLLGSIAVVEGLVHPDDLADATDTTTPGENDQSAVVFPDIRPPLLSPDPTIQAHNKAGIGKSLADDLRAIRTTLVKAHLSQHYEAAFDLFLFQFARAMFGSGYHPDALDVSMRETPDTPHLRGTDDNFAKLNIGKQMLDGDRATLPLDWLVVESDLESFTALCALPAADKQHLFASCVARTVNGQLSWEHGSRPELEAVVGRLDIDFAALVRPTADLLWNRVRKDRLLAVAAQVLGEAWAKPHTKSKKGELADALEQAFAASEDVPTDFTPDTHAKAQSWTPPGFQAFDSRAIDELIDDHADSDAEKSELDSPTPDTLPATPHNDITDPAAEDQEDSAVTEADDPLTIPAFLRRTP